ncbi:MAG: hypothetical protein IPF95_08060 [Flavobacteriales bacterium]|nr:hypothetical protein [Flavobacteriales bacterium]MBK7297184.1 hypothetical protein [Flavobacteriales bacterium]HQV52994.1 hypothetical protein [Flavobacteriales bacterium]
MTEKAENFVGFGYHVQNVEWNIISGGQIGSPTNSMTVRASYFSMILGAKWYVDNTKHFSFCLDVQGDLPITNKATGRRLAYIP